MFEIRDLPLETEKEAIEVQTVSRHDLLSNAAYKVMKAYLI